MNISVRLRTTRTSKKGAHPICLQIIWGTNVRYKTIKGHACRPQAWDFDEHCYKHSQKKNEELEAYLKKARRVADYMDEWDYKQFVKELDSTTKKIDVEKKKLIAFTKELELQFLNRKQVGYSFEFKALASFLSKLFPNDMPLNSFGQNELDKMIHAFDDKKVKGYTYLRTLKIVLSRAMEKGFYKSEFCPIKTKYSPFGYDINQRKKKESKLVKKNRLKHLSETEKEEVVDYFRTADIPPTQKKHLAYWVLAYRLFGVNFKDLAFITWDDIKDNMWHYSRKKTGHTIAGGKPIVAEVMELLKTYDTGGKYILDILNGYDDNEEMIEKRLKNYKSNVRRSLKYLSKHIFPDDDKYITWYSARYTAPTLALAKGVDLNTVRTLMNHTNIRTTSKYLAYVRDQEKLSEAMAVL